MSVYVMYINVIYMFLVLLMYEIIYIKQKTDDGTKISLVIGSTARKAVPLIETE